MVNILSTFYLLEMDYKQESDPRHISNCLKQEVARWTCAFGFFVCKKQAYLKLESHLLQEKYKYIFLFFNFYDTNSSHIYAVYVMLTKLFDQHAKASFS